MTQSRLELKVGLFVVICLGLLVGLVLEFSKGTTLFRHTYTITLDTSNVGGLRPRAAVLLSGVQVGTVSDIVLSRAGTNVSIILKIYSDYVIKDDARFEIEQSGFLGDQFVAVYPDANQGAPLKPGAEAHVDEPFNMLGVARSVAGFVKRIDETARNLDDAISDVRKQVLNQQTLTNLAFTIATLQQVSENAAVVVSNIDSLISTNAAPVGSVLSNLNAFSLQLDAISQSAQNLLNTNEPQITLTVNNLEASSAMLTNFLAESSNSKGLAGAVLYDQDACKQCLQPGQQSGHCLRQFAEQRPLAVSLETQTAGARCRQLQVAHVTLVHSHFVLGHVHGGRLRHQPGAAGVCPQRVSRRALRFWLRWISHCH
jgi:phospholipid/cholesterol/gamma-HCH transport system substrate-binding protein